MRAILVAVADELGQAPTGHGARREDVIEAFEAGVCTTRSRWKCGRRLEGQADNPHRLTSGNLVPPAATGVARQPTPILATWANEDLCRVPG